MKLLCQINDELHDLLSAGIIFGLVQKQAIQLHDVYRKLRKRIKGGIAASKIIHFNNKFHFLQPPDGIRQLPAVLYVGRFRNFQVKFLR